MWKEWIAAHVGHALGLPLPPFALVQVDECLLAELPSEWRHLGSTPAFGSRQRDNVVWFELSLVNSVPVEIRRAVLVFDWWIRNTDRQQGNTNLLWDSAAGELTVIDHNLAFDPEFDARTFLEHHLFAADWPALVSDLVTRAHWMERLTGVLDRARWARDNAPPEWRWRNAEQDIPTNYDPDDALATLARCTNADFWSTQ